MKKSKLSSDYLHTTIQAFTLRTSMMSGITMTPTEDILVHLGDHVTITPGNGVPLDFLKGDKTILVKGVTYTFGPEIALGLS